MAAIFDTPALTVFEQMAVDEVLAKQSTSEPVLRFYNWTPGRAVTFGYSQFYLTVKKQVPAGSGPLCRRPTGGGIVYHGADLTFSLLFENNLRPAEIYAQLHGAIEKALVQTHVLQSVRQGEVSTAAYAPAQNGIANNCFTNPVQDDLLVEGQKVLGGAIRRFGNKILYQGSLQYPGARSSEAYARAVQAGISGLLQVSFIKQELPEAILSQARQLAREQYMQASWIEKL